MKTKRRIEVSSVQSRIWSCVPSIARRESDEIQDRGSGNGGRVQHLRARTSRLLVSRRKITTALLPSFLILITILVLVGIACSNTDSIEPAPATQPDGLAATEVQSLSQASDGVREAASESVDIPAYLLNAWRCLGDDAAQVEDYTTPGENRLLCQVEVEYTDTSVVVRSTGIPNHDFESTLGCCASEHQLTWTIPLNPVEDTDGELTMAPERGAVAFTVTGVAIFGPEEGPGGDAVALEYGYFVED